MYTVRTILSSLKDLASNTDQAPMHRTPPFHRTHPPVHHRSPPKTHIPSRSITKEPPTRPTGPFRALATEAPCWTAASRSFASRSTGGPGVWRVRSGGVRDQRQVRRGVEEPVRKEKTTENDLQLGDLLGCSLRRGPWSLYFFVGQGPMGTSSSHGNYISCWELCKSLIKKHPMACTCKEDIDIGRRLLPPAAPVGFQGPYQSSSA